MVNGPTKYKRIIIGSCKCLQLFLAEDATLYKLTDQIFEQLNMIVN